MAINPLRIAGLDLPAWQPSAARPDPSVWSNLASIGDAIGQARERSRMSEILRGAIDPRTGALDIQKAATAVALSGQDPTRYLTLLEAEARRKEAQGYRQEQLDIAREGRDIQRQALDKPTQQVVPPSLMSPGGVFTIPRAGEPSFRSFPAPTPPPAPPATPGPQSELEIPPTALPAAAGPAERLPPAFYPPPGGPQTPSEGPPYQVAQAGPAVLPAPRPPSGAPAPAATPSAAATGRNEAILQRLPPAAQTIVKGIADYEIDPNSLTGRDREEAIAAAKLYRPDYNQTEFQKRATPPSSETQGRMGLGKGFLELVPQIKERIQKGELDFGLQSTTESLLRRGGPGELINTLDEGADSLLRGLTGAGMPETEAAKYVRRYGWSITDDRRTRIQKLNGLERALRFVITEQGIGRGGEDLLKGYVSQFGKDVLEAAPVAKVKSDAEANTLVGNARAAFKRDPGQRDEIIKRLRDRGVPNPELLLGQ